MTKARKIVPPAGLSEADRRLYAAAPAPRLRADGTDPRLLSEAWILDQSPAHLRGAYSKGQISLATLANRLADGRLQSTDSKPLSNSDASLEGTVYFAGGVRPNPTKSSLPTRFRLTEREGGNRDAGRYVSRVIETTAKGVMPDAEEREAFVLRDLDAEALEALQAEAEAETPNADAVALLLDGLDAETAQMRAENVARANRLGIAI